MAKPKYLEIRVTLKNPAGKTKTKIVLMTKERLIWYRRNRVSSPYKYLTQISNRKWTRKKK